MKIQFQAKTFDAEYCGVGYLQMLKMQVYDERSLSEIAPDVESSNEIVMLDDNGKEQEHYDGYTQLIRIERIDQRAVDVLLAKPAGDTE